LEKNLSLPVIDQDMHRPVQQPARMHRAPRRPADRFVSFIHYIKKFFGHRFCLGCSSKK